jgi:hypothetical protein
MQPADFVAQGIAVIPVLFGSKKPAIRWQRYQTQLPTPAQLARWFRPGRRTNAAVVCGWNGLVVIDFDVASAYTSWLSWCAVRGGTALAIAAHSYRVETSRGMHVYVRCNQPAHTGLLWASDDARAHWHSLIAAAQGKGGAGQVQEAARAAGALWGDVKGPGSLATIPPSVHPSGVPYLAVDEDAPILLVDQLADVLTCVPTQPAPVGPSPRLLRTVDRDALCPGDAIDELKQRLSVLDLFPDAQRTGTGRYYQARCPWHEDREPSLSIDTQTGRVRCFAGCTESADGRRHSLDVIDVYVRLHACTTKQAIRELKQLAGVA